MTALLDIAIEQVRALPPERQEEIAQVLLDMTAADDDVYVLTPEEEASFAQALDDIEAGRTLTSQEAHAVWSKLKA